MSNPALRAEPAKRPGHETLGAILVRRGSLRPEDLERAVETQRASGKRLGDVLVEAGLVDADQVSAACCPWRSSTASCR